MMNWWMLHKALKRYMKFSKLGLLTLLISLFILNSCKNQDGIGLGVDPGSELNGTIMVDTSMVVATVADDSLITSGLFRAPLSYFKDPEFGVTESNIAAALTLPGGQPYTLPTGEVVVDSAVLILPYVSGFYGDSLTSRFKLDVYQLSERVMAQPYSNLKTWAHEANTIGTKTFVARPSDSLKVTLPIKGKKDSLLKVVPQIRVRLLPAFFQTNFFNAPASWRANVAVFQANVKGLYLALDKSQTTGPGGNIMLSMDSAKVGLYIRTSTASAIDTALVTLPVGRALRAANIKHTYSVNVQSAITTPTANANFYLQPMAGLRGKITFPNVKNMFASVGSDVVINRAELIVKVAPGTNIPYAAAPKLTLYQLDLAKQRITLQDASPSDPRGANGPGFFGGYYNSATGEYHFTVTGYLQDLVRGKTVDYGTFLAPVDPTAGNTVNIFPTAQYAQRTIGIGKNSPNRIRLSIIYTKINK
jgi:hypothetical protein